MSSLRWLALLTMMVSAGCDSDKRPSTPRVSATAVLTADVAKVERAFAYPTRGRIVAIGDVHGDLTATRTVLRLAGAIDENDQWTGNQLIVVQTGDQLDRGDQEQAIVDLFDHLAEQAHAAGGAVYALNGNHEVMNVALDFRYVTEGGFKDFEDLADLNLTDSKIASLPSVARARAAAFLPGAPYAKKLAKRNVIVMVGETVFVHGGVLPSHVQYGIDRINREVQAWMDGKAVSPPAIVMAEDAPVWTRRYSDRVGADDCAVLKQALTGLSAKRMVVGHTVQKGGITSACDDRVWRIDVGLAAHYGGRPEALEITGDSVRVLKADSVPR